MWPLELKYVDPAEIDAGPVPTKRINLAWGLMAGFYLVSLAAVVLYGFIPPLLGLLFIPIGIVLARMVAVDLCYLLLLNIYTLPLTLVGLGFSVFLLARTWQDALLGIVVGAGIGLIIDVILHLLRRGEAELGFGDVKLLAALGAWVGFANLPFALTVAFLANFIFSLFVPKGSAIPFGFGLGLGIWALTVLEVPFMLSLIRVMS